MIRQVARVSGYVMRRRRCFATQTDFWWRPEKVEDIGPDGSWFRWMFQGNREVDIYDKLCTVEKRLIQLSKKLEDAGVVKRETAPDTNSTRVNSVSERDMT